MQFKNIYSCKSWASECKEFKITAIFDDEQNKEIQILMPQGKSMCEHSAPGQIIVQVLRGEIDFKIGDETLLLKELDSIKVAKNVAHSLFAKKDSIIRLSLAKNDALARVESVKVE